MARNILRLLKHTHGMALGIEEAILIMASSVQRKNVA